MGQTLGVFKFQLKYMLRNPINLMAILVFSVLISMIPLMFQFHYISGSNVKLGTGSVIFNTDVAGKWKRDDNGKFSCNHLSAQVSNETKKSRNITFLIMNPPLRSFIYQIDKVKLRKCEAYKHDYWYLPSLVQTVFGENASNLKVTNYSGDNTANDEQDDNLLIPMLLVGLLMPGLGMSVANFIFGFLENDKMKQLKSGLLISGLSEQAYWTGHLSAFFLYCLVVSLLMPSLLVVTGLSWDRILCLSAGIFLYLVGIVLFKTVTFEIFDKKGSVRKLLELVFSQILPMIFFYILTIMPYMLNYEIVLFLVCTMPVFSMSLLPIILIFKNSPVTESVSVNIPSANVILLIMTGYVIFFISILGIHSYMKSLKGRYKHEKYNKNNKILPDSAGPADHPVKNYPRESVAHVESSLYPKVLSVQNLSKHYIGVQREKIKALKNVSFDVYQNEVFAVIGHNGSGKSTLLSTLVGLQEPTLGSFELENKSENSLGFCPQKDVLYDCMTVMDHLWFMSNIRNISGNKTEIIKNLVNDLELGPLLYKKAGILSGGEKRRVCVALAFIGNPKLVILDEPSSGMDPKSRIIFWKFVEKVRQHCSIIICTHFMDEADSLADRKAFLSHGELKCLGSSQFFRQIFKCGYTVAVEGNPGSMRKVANLIEHHNLHFTYGRKVQHKGKDHLVTIDFIIHNDQIINFLEDLEGKKADLGYESFQLRENGLEKIFLESEVFDVLEKYGRARSDSILRTSSTASQIQNSLVEDSLNKINESTQAPSTLSALVSLLWFQLRSCFTSKYHLIGKALAAIFFCMGIWLFNKYFTVSTDDIVDLNDPLIYRELFGNHKFSFDPSCKDLLKSIPNYAKTSGSNLLRTHPAYINCGDNGDFTVDTNSLFPGSSYFASYYVAKMMVQAKDVDINVTFTGLKPDDTMKTVTLSIKTMIIVFIINAALEYILLKVISYHVRDRLRTTFLLYTFDMGPFSVYLSGFLRSLIYSTPMFVAIYCVCVFILETTMSNFTVIFLLNYLACLLMPILISLISDDERKARNLYSFVSWVSLVISVILQSLCTLMHGVSIVESLNRVYRYASIFLSPSILLFQILQKEEPNENAIFGVGTYIILLLVYVFCACILIAIIEYRHVFVYFFSSPDDEALDKAFPGVILCDVSKRIVKNFDMKIRKDSLVCLLGSNGAGKTTVLKMITSQLMPEQGWIQCFGINPQRQKYESLRNLGYCAQEGGLLVGQMTVYQHLDFFVSLLTQDSMFRQRAVQALAQAFSFEYNLNTRISNLSGGTRRKVCCAIAMIKPSRQLLVLDEPTTGVDAAARESMWQVFKAAKRNRAIIITTHYLREASMSDFISVMKSGSILCEGTEFDLIQRYGSGYHIKIRFEDHHEDTSERMAEWLLHINSSKEGPILEGEKWNKQFQSGSFSVNPSALKSLGMHGILALLEKSKKDGILSSYSITSDSMDDVFLRAMNCSEELEKPPETE